jgi:hypothetical protein
VRGKLCASVVRFSSLEGDNRCNRSSTDGKYGPEIRTGHVGQLGAVGIGGAAGWDNNAASELKSPSESIVCEHPCRVILTTLPL